MQLHQRVRVHLRAVEGARLLEANHAARQPLRVRRRRRHLPRDGGVLFERAGGEVDGDHHAGAEAALRDDVPRIGQHVAQHARLRRHVHEAVVGAPEAGGAQAVAVEARAECLAVAEHQQRGAVPRLLQAAVVVIEGRHLRVLARQLRVVAIRLGDEQHHRLRHAAPGAHQQLRHPVQVGGIGGGGVADGAEGRFAAGPHRVRHRRLARSHPVQVALQRVDLPVVTQEAHRLRQRPLGRRVGGEAAVVDGEGGDEGLVPQVGEEGGDPHGAEHALVHDGAAGEGAEVERLAVEAGRGGCCGLHALAHDVQLALQLVAAQPAGAHNHLLDGGLGALRDGAHHGGVHGHGAPAEQRQALLFQHFRHQRLGRRQRGRLPRQEGHAHGGGTLLDAGHARPVGPG